MKTICFNRYKTIVNNQRDVLILGEICAVIQAAEDKTVNVEKLPVRFLFSIGGGRVKNSFEVLKGLHFMSCTV